MNSKSFLKFYILLFAVLTTSIAYTQTATVYAPKPDLPRQGAPNPPGQVAENEKAVNEAYLFAHMTHQDYGRLYYSVSLDGLHWYALNNRERVFDDYRGHPDICKGHDGRYYLTGNRGNNITIWVSEDLIKWEVHTTYTPDLKSTPGYSNNLGSNGVPKLYYHESTRQYILVWQTPHERGTKEDPERFWASQRALYVLSKDLKTFSEHPTLLFEWDMATIDVSIRKVGEHYYAIIKDEI